MSEDQLNTFLEKVRGDTSLQEKLKSAANVDAVVAIAKASGFVLSADDLKQAKPELSEEELESVAGGGGAWLGPTITNPKCTACLEPSPCG